MHAVDPQVHRRTPHIRSRAVARDFSAPAGKIPRRACFVRDGSEERGAFLRFPYRWGWLDSCPECGELHVFRAAVVSIVLTMMVGPNARLLCSVWCHPDEPRTSACEHEDATTSPQVTGQASCHAAPADATAFVVEESRRGSPGNDAQHVVVVRGCRFASPAIDISHARPASESLSAAGPPLLTALRI